LQEESDGELEEGEHEGTDESSEGELHDVRCDNFKLVYQLKLLRGACSVLPL